MSAGAIFDWDGVVIDSSAAHERSWEQMAAEESFPLPADHFKRGFGRKNEVIFCEILGWTQDRDEIIRLGARKEELYRLLVADNLRDPMPGVRTLLRNLKEAGVPCVVGSSTPRINIEFIIAQLGLDDCFHDVVAAEDVSHGKPDPEVFLLAAGKIDVPPAQCVVFEDATYGVEAARRGGMKCIAVTSTNPREKLTEADWIVDSLAEVTLESFHELASRPAPTV